MILLDTTRTSRSGHRSGLTRVTGRLAEALGDRARAVTWESLGKHAPAAGDWFLTAEVFSEAERPGFRAFLNRRACRTAAIFHDAIPLRLPHVTWPQSVARHPSYLGLLSSFDRIWAVSVASRDELLGFWRWQRVERHPPVDVIALGADFDAAPRRPAPQTPPAPVVLCVGILEPRKNQTFLLEVCRRLWDSGQRFELHYAGRINPHFGKPIAQAIRAAAKSYPGLHFHEAPSDAVLAGLMERARVVALPSIAEGCGLPVLESLWRGIPCIASDLPSIRENAVGGGCLCVKAGDADSWAFALSRLLSDDEIWRGLARDASVRHLVTWADCAQLLAQGLSED